MLQTLSNRELALGIWFLILILLVLTNKGVRKSSLGILSSLISISLQKVFLSYSLYIFIVILILKEIHFWNFLLIKDTLFWFLSFAVPMFFKTPKVDNNKFFKTLLLNSLKLTIIIEFITNLFSFSIWVELLLFPILLFLVLFDFVAESEEKFIRINSFAKTILSIIGFVVFLYSLIMTIINFDKSITSQTFKQLLLPIIFSIATIPALFIVVLYMKYESLFVRIPILFDEKDRRRKLKMAIIINAKLDLKKVELINSKINRWDLSQAANINAYVKKLVN